MEIKTNNKRSGISLIVLVITVIVIIILAVAVILTLANNNVIENAKKAVEANDVATAKELMVLSMAEYELITEIEKKDVGSLEEYVEGKLIDAGFNMEENDEIKEYFYENVKLIELVNAGYIVNVLDGEVYLTGLDTAEKRKVSYMNGLGYSVYSYDNVLQGEIYNLSTRDIIKDDDGNELATIVLFGDTDYQDGVTSGDTVPISSYINAYGTVEFSQAVLYSMDTNHDGYISYNDIDVIKAEVNRREDINQNTKIIALRDDMETISGIDYYLPLFGIAENNSYEVVSDEIWGECYAITLNGEYTYASLYNAIISNLQNNVPELEFNVEYYDENDDEISNESTESVALNKYILIYTNGADGENVMYLADEFILKVK